MQWRQQHAADASEAFIASRTARRLRGIDVRGVSTFFCFCAMRAQGTQKRDNRSIARTTKRIGPPEPT
jgi:hypothetical protein